MYGYDFTSDDHAKLQITTKHFTKISPLSSRLDFGFFKDDEFVGVVVIRASEFSVLSQTTFIPTLHSECCWRGQCDNNATCW